MTKALASTSVATEETCSQGTNTMQEWQNFARVLPARAAMIAVANGDLVAEHDGPQGARTLIMKDVSALARSSCVAREIRTL
jgi:hypothetical protein